MLAGRALKLVRASSSAVGLARYTGFAGDFGQLIEDGPPSECPYLLEQILKADEMQQKGVPPYVFNEEKAKKYKWSPELIEKRQKMAANNKRP